MPMRADASHPSKIYQISDIDFPGRRTVNETGHILTFSSGRPSMKIRISLLAAAGAASLLLLSVPTMAALAAPVAGAHAPVAASRNAASRDSASGPLRQ